MLNLDAYEHLKYKDTFIFLNRLYTVIKNNKTSITIDCTLTQLDDLSRNSIYIDFYKNECDIPLICVIKEIYNKEIKDTIEDCLNDYIRFSAV